MGDWTTTLELLLKRNKVQTLKESQRKALTEITGTSDAVNQLRALTRFHDAKRIEYYTKLLDRAPDHLSEFVEYMTPDEPPARHHEFIIGKFEAIERRDILRATFSMPPGHAKTKILSRYGPAWYLGKNPMHRWLQGAHSQDFVENEIGRYVRDIISDGRGTADEDEDESGHASVNVLEPAFCHVFPEVRLNPRSTAMGSWRLAGVRGAYAAKGVGQSISGYRGNIGAIDDPIGKGADAQSPTYRRGQKKWLMTDFRQRLLPGSPLFVVATRWHKDDMIGFCEQLNKEGKGIPWEIINLNGVIETQQEMEDDILGRSMFETLWPDYYDFAHVMDIKATMDPPGDWWALWKGTPRDAEGLVVKKSWFTRYEHLPRDQIDTLGRIANKIVKRLTVSVDCAEKATARSKYTAVTVWLETEDNRHHLVDVRRKRCEFPDMIRLIEDTVIDWNNKGYKVGCILVEDAANGTPYIQQRRGQAPAPIISIPKPSADSKVRRFDGTTTMWEGGEVLLPKSAKWLPDYEDEILGFPDGTFSDQVDSTSQYLTWARQKRKTYGTQKLFG